MTQTNANSRQGGRVRELRQIRLNIIIPNNEGWVDKRDDSPNNEGWQWQVRLPNGWASMPSNLGNELSKAHEHGICDVQATHRWTNPGGKSKTTEYSFDLERMTALQSGRSDWLASMSCGDNQGHLLWQGPYKYGLVRQWRQKRTIWEAE